MEKSLSLCKYLLIYFLSSVEASFISFITFSEIDIDSLEFVKLVKQIESKLKKKYHPVIDKDILKINLKKFLALFK